MSKFPVDAPKRRVVQALLTMPNHRTIKASTLRTICTQSGISREEFLEAYRHS